MDTHIASRAEIQVEQPDAVPEIASPPMRGRGLFRRGAARLVERETPAPPQAVEPALLPRRRNGLMTTACAAVVLAAASGVFWISPYNHSSLADFRRAFSRVQDAAEATLAGAEAPAQAAPPTAPAAALARAPVPFRAKSPAEAVSATGGDDMARFLNFRSHEALAPVPPASTPKPPPATVAAATAPPATAAAPATVAVPMTAPASQAQPVVASVAQSAEAVKHDTEVVKLAAAPVVPTDPVAAIALLRAAPMTEPQQVQVLELLTQLGTVVHDQRAEIAQLRLDQQHVGQRVDGNLADFNRRVALAEARGAVSAAMANPIGVSTAASPSGDTRLVASVVAASDTAPHRYHVQAASPGLAMLSELDASGGEQRQLPVSLGDPVPGLGKVFSIFQRGASWAVKTEHGLIQ